MNDKIEITELVLQMGPTKVSMSLKDAEKVFKVLEKLFGRKVEKEYVPYETYRPYRWWYYGDTYKPYITFGSNTGLEFSKTSNHFDDSPKFELSKITDNFSVQNGQLTLDVKNVNANLLS